MQKDCESLLEEVATIAFNKFEILTKKQKEYIYNSLKFIKENNNEWNVITLIDLKNKLEDIKCRNS